jgi:hypothetical protein
MDDDIEIWLDESPLPPDFNPTRFEIDFKVDGKRWRCRKADSDTRFPHAHVVGSGIKINLLNGDLYDCNVLWGNDQNTLTALLSAINKKGYHVGATGIFKP